MSNAQQQGELDKDSLERLYQLFKRYSNENSHITQEGFGKLIVTKNPYFSDRIFKIFDLDGNGLISLPEFIQSIHKYAVQSQEDKIKFLFKVYDSNDDGFIQPHELYNVISACTTENGLNFSMEQISELTLAMFEDADPFNNGQITYEAFKRQILKHEGLLDNLNISIDNWLAPLLHDKISNSKKYIVLKGSYWKNNYVYFYFTFLYLLCNIALFVTRAFDFRESAEVVIIARACGQCLNFTCAFIVVLMLRQCITFLRSKGFSKVLPLDQHISLHKMTGILITLFGVVHGICHYVNFALNVVTNPAMNPENYSLATWLLTSIPGILGLIKGYANITGLFIIIILLIMFICSQRFVRRSGKFEIFYFTHLLYIPFFILLIIHAPNFWKWFVGPGIIFLIEKLLGLSWMFSSGGKTFISSGVLLPSKVTNLIIKRPCSFNFRPGDYVFVKIPAIARYEWHPFTLSSAPENEQYLTLHIRAVGEWTNQLRKFFEKEEEKIRGSVNVQDKVIELRKTGGFRPSLQKITSSMEQHITLFKKNRGAGQGHGDDRNNKIQNRISKLVQERHKYQPEVSPKGPGRTVSMIDIQQKLKMENREIVLFKLVRSSSEDSIFKDINKKKSLKAKVDESARKSYRFLRNQPTFVAFQTPKQNIHNPKSRFTRKTLVSFSPVDAEEGRVVLSQRSSKFVARAELDTPDNVKIGNPLKIYIDGPYGAPSSHIFRAQHAVLIATGIGVTPFASILQSIMHRYLESRITCPKCEHKWCNTLPKSVMKLRKVDFFWINRDQHSFEWFINLLTQLEIEQAETGGTMDRFLDMHMYMTSVLQKTDMKAVGLQLALDLLHTKEQRDLITGLRTRTNAGRPNWDKVFSELQNANKGNVTVFYCGPPQLANTLQYKCNEFGFSFSKEIF